MDVKRGLLLDANYNGRLNKVQLRFYNLDTNKIYRWTDDTKYLPYCLAKYVAKEESEALDKNWAYKGHEIVKRMNLLTGKEEEYYKLYGRNPMDIRILRKIVKYTYENTIRFHQNFIYDKKLQIGHVYRITNNKLYEYKGTSGLDIVAKIIENEPKEYGKFALENYHHFFQPFPKVRMVAMDIEVVDKFGMPNVVKADRRIISCAFYGNDGTRLFIVDKSRFGKKRLTAFPTLYVKDEVELIKAILQMINKYPIVLTFNGDNFDLPYIYNRMYHHFPNQFRNEDTIYIKDGWGFKSKYDAFLKNSIHIDIYNYFSNKAIKQYAYGHKYKKNSLDDISSALLGIAKIRHDLVPISSMSVEALAKYNMRDVELTMKLIERNDYQAWMLILLFCRITSLPISDLLRHQISFWIKSILTQEHKRNNCIIPNPEDIRRAKPSKHFTDAIIEGKSYRGAYVIQPKKGIHYDTVVMDFASLYPSIIKEFNLSYETINCGHKECRKNKLKGTPYHSCIKKMGVFAYVVAFLRDIRVKHFKILAKTDNYYKPIEQALKVFINGSYGVFGSERFPYFCLPVAETTTAIGWESIKATIDKCEEMKIDVVYGDTDSVFLDNPTQLQIDILTKWSRLKLDLELDYEKTYQFLALSNRKKNYVGVIKGTNQIDMKGITGKKSNTPEVIRDAINKMNLILVSITNEASFNKQRSNIIKTYHDVNRRIGVYGVYPLDKFAINVTLSKNPKDYVKNIPQHIRAIAGVEKDYKSGDVVSYVKCMHNTPILTHKAKNTHIDITKYRALLKSSAIQVLDALDISWDEVLGIKKITDFTK